MPTNQQMQRIEPVLTSTTFRVACAALLILNTIGNAQPPRPKRTASQEAAAPRPKPPESTAKLSLANLFYYLVTNTNAGSKDTIVSLDDLVRQRDLSFRGDESGLIKEALKALGAPDSLLARVAQPPDPPPPRSIAGNLTVECRPLDCGIVIENAYYGETKNGTKTISGLDRGKVTIQMFGERIEQQKTTLELGEDHQTKLFTTVELTSVNRIRELEALAEQWERLYKAIKVLGGSRDVKALSTFGTLQYEKEQKSDPPLNVSVTLSADDWSRMVGINGFNCTFPSVGFATTRCEKQKGAKKARGANEDLPTFPMRAEVALALNVLVQNLPIRRLEDLPATDIVSQRANLIVDDKGLPLEIEYTDGTERIMVSYADYRPVGKGQFPERIVIKKGAYKYTWQLRLR